MREMFGDFELEFEFKINEGGNSGLIYRLTEEESRSYWTGSENQILELANRKRNPSVHFCGSITHLPGRPKNSPTDRESGIGGESWLVETKSNIGSTGTEPRRMRSAASPG